MIPENTLRNNIQKEIYKNDTIIERMETDWHRVNMHSTFDCQEYEKDKNLYVGFNLAYQKVLGML